VNVVERYESVSALREILEVARRTGRTVGLVPTMGALHRGHESLIEQAAGECDEVVVTIFVNPLQFGDPGDLERYPRNEAADLEVCARTGATRVFVPSVVEMYPTWPTPPLTTVSVARLGTRWEGASRPGHFDGVATVVAKLFALAGPCRAYFGEKDFQQLAVLRAMVADLWLPVEIVGCPTVRDADGLALSSRNVRLDDDQRAVAPVLARALAAGGRAVRSGVSSPAQAGALMAAVCAQEPLIELDYAVVVDPVRLEVPETLESGSEYRLLIAATLGGVRLIDNSAASVGVAPIARIEGVHSPQLSGERVPSYAQRSGVA
jgi:pantoate--beta-alanine ligase